MITNDIVGNYVTLRSIKESDAIFALSIRQDERMTRYLPRLNISLEQQIEWIHKQQKTEGDYFFIVWRNKENSRIGTIGLYDVKNGRGETGRLAMTGVALESIEAEFLLQKFGYDTLGLHELYSYIFPENKSALRFSGLFGAMNQKLVEHKPGQFMLESRTTKEDFEPYRKKLYKMLYRKVEKIG